MLMTIEQLELEVQTSSSSAVQGIDALSEALGRLKEATKGGIGLSTVANQLSKLSTSLESLDSGSIDKLDKLAKSLESLKNFGNIKLSSTIAKQITSIAQSTSALNGTNFDAIDKLSKALGSLNNLTKPDGLTAAMKQLVKLPELAQSLDKINWDSFTDNMKQLSDSLAPLVNQLNSVSDAFSRLPRNLNQVVEVSNKVSKANDKVGKSYVNLWAKITMVGKVVNSSAKTIAKWITASNQYGEDINLFTASLGRYANEAQEYAEKVGAIMGIDPGDWMRNQGVFNTIISGFGVASDQAYLMSKNLTQLGYDLSSFFNISVDDAMQKLQSGISGELEPLRRLGYDLSVARLQEDALALGIEKKVSAMSQAEKSQLRYYEILTQVTVAQGDMARTLNTPANQMRVLKSQVTQCARALGNIFIPALNAVLPYAIALVEVVKMLANEIASLFGFTLPEIDYTGVGELASGATDASDGLNDAAKAAKKLKNATLGIDELNILSDKNSDSDNDSGKSGKDLGIELPEYDFLGELVNTRIQSIVTMITSALGEITAVASTFALAIGTILVVTGINIPLGIGLMAAGAVGLGAVTVVNWNSMSERLAATLTVLTATLGGFLLAIGAFLTLSGVNVPLGIGLMVAGAVNLGTATAINWKFLEGDLSNALSILVGIVSGAMLAMGALFAFTGVSVPLGIGLMVAGAIGLATAVGLNWDSLSEPLRKAIGTLAAIVGSALLVFGAILAVSGVNMPLGIGLIAAGAVLLVSAVALNWGALTGDLKKSLSTLISIVSGALIGIGAILALTGVSLPLGITMIAVGAVGIVATAGINWGALLSKVKAVLKEIGIAVGIAFLAVGAILALTGVSMPLGIAFIAAGAVSLISGVALNWEAITNKIKAVLKEIGIIAGAAMLAIGVILCLTGVGIPLGVALIAAGAASLVSGVVLNWDAIQDKVKEGLGKVSDKFGDFKDNVKTKLDGAKDVITTWAGNVKEWFTKGKDGKGVVQHFKDLAIDIVDGFKNGIRDKYETCKQTITTWATKVGDWFKEKLGIHSPSTVFFGYGENTTSGFNDAISSKYETSEQGISTWAESIKKWFTNSTYGGINTSSFGKFAKNAVEGFSSKIGSSYTSTKSNIDTWAKSTKDWFSSIASSSAFGGFATNVIDGFKNRIGEHYTSAKTNMQTFGSKVKSWFTHYCSSSSFYDIASDVVSGFKNGIGALYSTCKSTISSWGSSIITWFKDKLDVNSPSRVFYSIGEFAVEGFDNAIKTEGQSTKKAITTWFNSFSGISPMVGFPSIVAPKLPNATMALSVDTSALSYCDPYYYEGSIYTEVSRKYGVTIEGFEEGLEKFYRDRVEPVLNRMADDVRRQADKEEQTIVQVGNRTINDAVTTQKKANGYSFTE